MWNFETSNINAVFTILTGTKITIHIVILAKLNFYWECNNTFDQFALRLSESNKTFTLMLISASYFIFQPTAQWKSPILHLPWKIQPLLIHLIPYTQVAKDSGDM